MTSSFKQILSNMIAQVTDAIERHERNEKAPLSIQSLIQVKKELEEMMKIMDPNIYIPKYPRFIIDWPGEDPLINKLVHTAALYEKLKKY